MSVAERRDAVCPVLLDAAVSSHTDVKRIDEPRHYCQDLFAGKAVERNMFVSYPPKLRHIHAKTLDLGKLFSLLRLGKFWMINILEPTACVDTYRLQLTSGRR